MFQFYPSDQTQTDLITSQAKRAGFNGGLVIDFPESTKARKYYLVLVAGAPSNGNIVLPAAKTMDARNGGPTVSYSNRNEKAKKHLKNKTPVKHSKEWILQKKERRRRQGRDVRPDNKYTGRKRGDKF